MTEAIRVQLIIQKYTAIYSGEELILSSAVTVSTVYFSAFGKYVECKNNNPAACWNGIYGEKGVYKSTVPTLSGGSGGGWSSGIGTGTSTIDDSVNYTKDIFGNEHLTHIGYINGYWANGNILALYEEGLITGYDDGTFRPENSITRAEVMPVMNKILGRNPSEEYVKTLNFNPFNDLSLSKWYYVIVLEATITHNYILNDDGHATDCDDCK